jgi:hypothetical protein
MKYSKFENIAEVIQNTSNSTIQGPTSSHMMQNGSSRGWFPSRLPILGFTVGSYEVATTVVVLRHSLCLQD